jgi:exodeoxyribonuclease VII small subunit
MREDAMEARQDQAGESGFEGLMRDVEEIVERLGSGDVELEEALALFERGVARLRAAAQLLDGARGRVEELIESAAGELAFRELEATPGRNGESDGA